MKLSEAFRLGHLNIATHKRRSLMVIIVIAVVFGLLFAATMMLEGLENSILGVLTEPTDGKVYLKIWAGKYNGNEQGELATQEDVTMSLKGLQAESLGQLKMRANYPVLPKEIAENFMEKSLNEVPEGEVPLIVSLSQASYMAQMSMPTRGKAKNRINVMEKIHEVTIGQSFEGVGEQQYYVIGVMPGGGVNSLSLENVGQNSNPLNPILAMVGVDGGDTYAVADGREEISREMPYLVSFTDAQEALKFTQQKGVCYSSYYSCQTGDLVVSDAFGGVLASISHIKILQLVLVILGLVLAVANFIVMYFTLVRVIGQDARAISLYYALGATKRDVYKIYFCYVMELALWTVVSAVILGVVAVMLLSVVNAEAFTALFYLAYGVKGYHLWLIGWGAWAWILVGIMVLMMAVCYLGNLWQFSARRLGRKLKN